MFIICTRKSDSTVEGLVLVVRYAYTELNKQKYVSFLNLKFLKYYFLSLLFFTLIFIFKIQENNTHYSIIYIFIISPKLNYLIYVCIYCNEKKIIK